MSVTSFSATELIAKIKARELSAVEVVEAHLDLIMAQDPRIKAWVCLEPDKAIDRAKQIDAQIATNTFTGTLFGIPCGVKDIFNTLDMPTCMGSPIWEGFMPGNDARVVQYLRQAGAVFPGKTVTAEFAVHAPGETRNPRNLDYSPGTSSSGSAAAVAADMVPLALGTQTAGSIMRPASYCGVCGFKPSFGLVPRTGVLKTAETLDTVGGFGKTPEDLRLLFDTIRVKGHNFPTSHPVLTDLARQKKSGRPWRIGLPENLMESVFSSHTQDYLLEKVNALESHAECSVTKFNIFDDLFSIHGLHQTIYSYNLAYYFQREFGENNYLSEIIYVMMRQGKAIPHEIFDYALQEQQRLCKEFDSLMCGFDALLLPTTNGIAPAFKEEDQKDTCLIWTFLMAPTISLPLMIGQNNMPIGLMLIGRRLNDFLLLDLANFVYNTLK